MAHSGHNKNSRYAHATNGQTPSNGRFLGFYERQVINPASDDILWVVTGPFENRPDLIANKYYGNPRLMWVILLRNSDIENPLTDLYTGRTIFIPSKTRLQSEILS